MGSVRLSVIIPTMGRASLAVTLQSIIDAGIRPIDEVIVVADGGEPDVHHIADISGLADKCCLRVIDLLPQGGEWGHPARNLGTREATGTHLVFTQDDNAFIEGALLAVREEAELRPEALHFWRVKPQSGMLVWTSYTEDLQPIFGQIDADCGVVPNDKATLGEWGEGYSGDYPFWRDTALNYAGRIVWHPEMISGNQRYL